jgi:hypothetical protein
MGVVIDGRQDLGRGPGRGHIGGPGQLARPLLQLLEAERRRGAQLQPLRGKGWGLESCGGAGAGGGSAGEQQTAIDHCTGRWVTGVR